MVLIDEVEAGVKDKKLGGGVDGPSSQEKERVYGPEGLWLGQKVLQHDADGVDEAAAGPEYHGPVICALLFLEYSVYANVDVDEDEEYDGDEAARG